MGLIAAPPDVLEDGGAVPGSVGFEGGGAVTVRTVVMVEPPGSVVTMVVDEGVGVSVGVVEVDELVGGIIVLLLLVVDGVVVVVDVDGEGGGGGGGGGVVDVVGVGVTVGAVVVGSVGIVVLLVAMVKTRRLSRGYSLHASQSFPVGRHCGRRQPCSRGRVPKLAAAESVFEGALATPNEWLSSFRSWITRSQ